MSESSLTNPARLSRSIYGSKTRVGRRRQLGRGAKRTEEVEGRDREKRENERERDLGQLPGPRGPQIEPNAGLKNVASRWGPGKTSRRKQTNKRTKKQNKIARELGS